MATTHAPGARFGPLGGKRARRAAIVAAVVLVCGAIVTPFVLHALDRGDTRASAAVPVSTSSTVTAPAHHRRLAVDADLGPHGGLPALVGKQAGPADRASVRIGDLTSGVLRRTPAGRWQVLVRWDGKVQPVTTRGPVGLGGPAAPRVTSWVSADRLLYTRIPLAAGRFRVYAWDPRGATAYTPPTLVAVDLGPVCFNDSFTAYGDCRTAR